MASMLVSHSTSLMRSEANSSGSCCSVSVPSPVLLPTTNTQSTYTTHKRTPTETTSTQTSPTHTSPNSSQSQSNGLNSHTLAPLITDLLSPNTGSPQSVESTESTESNGTTRVTAGALDEMRPEQREAMLNARSQSAALREAYAIQNGSHLPKSTQSNRRHRPSDSFTIGVSHCSPPGLPTSSRPSSSSENGSSPEETMSLPHGSTHATRTPNSNRNSHSRSASLFPFHPKRFPSSTKKVSPSTGERGTWSIELSRARTPSSTTSTASNRSATDGSPSNACVKKFSMSLNLNEVTLDRAESYVVREHTVVVGAYRINQHGLYANQSPPICGDDLLDDEEEEMYEEEEMEEAEEDAEVMEDTGLSLLSPGRRSSIKAEIAETSDAPTPLLTNPTLFDTAGAAAEMVEKFDGTSQPIPNSPTQGLMATDLPDLQAAFATKQRPGGSRRGSLATNASSGRRRSLVGGASLPMQQSMSLSKADLIELEVVGRGQNGVVKKALHLPTLTRVALKTMDVYEKSMRHQLLHELHAYSGLNSPYLIRLLGAYHDAGVIFLASEYMDMGSLAHCMERSPTGCISNETILKHLSFQILQGLKYLHENLRLHRDIKPDNIMLSRRSFECKIGDFGLMLKLQENDQKTNEFMGTLAFLSPERLSSSDYSYPADIWSLGISLIRLATGQFPIVGGSFWEFLGQMEEEPPSLEMTLRKIREAKFKRAELTEFEVQKPEIAEQLSFSPEFHDFIAKMLNMDPAVRWTASQLLSHPFLANIDYAIHASTREPTFWNVSEVAQRDEHDLYIVLEILAKRQLIKSANKAADRIHRQQLRKDTHQRSHSSLQSGLNAIMSVQSPGYAASSAPDHHPLRYAIHGTRGSLDSGTMSVMASKISRELSPLPSPNPPNTPAAVFVTTSDSTRSTVSSLSSSRSFEGGSDSSSSLTLPSCSHLTSASSFVSTCSSITDFASPSTSTSSLADTPFFNSPPAARMNFASPSPLLSTTSCSSVLSPDSFVLPAAPTMDIVSGTTTSPTTPSHHERLINSVNVIHEEPVPGTVEILAIVRRLDLVRARVLAHQFSRSVDEIQNLFADVQVALFDALEREQNGGGRDASTTPPSQHDLNANSPIQDHSFTAPLSQMEGCSPSQIII